MSNRRQRRKAKAQARKTGYRHRLLAAAPELAAAPGVSHAVIQHDANCGVFQGGPCDCVPDISIVPMSGGGVLLIDEQGETHRTGRQ